jgi:hypothetical protein
MNYTNYTNLDARFSRTYEPGDRLVKGWSDRIGAYWLSGGDDSLNDLAEIVYGIHNRDDRPDGQLCPAMSVGDVVVIGEVALSVDRAGFKIVQLDANDIQSCTYLEAVR